MADELPNLTLPRGLPCWLAAGHSVELMPIYADVLMRTGHARKRRVWRSAPRVVPVGLALSEPQMHRFFRWFEDTLRAGEEPFAAHLPNQGPGMLWWRAVFFEPPIYETGLKALVNGQLLNSFRVTAKLLLTGSGSDTGPVDTTMASTATVALHGSVVVTVPKSLASESLVELVQATRLRSDVTVALVAAAPTGTAASVSETAATEGVFTATNARSALATDAAATTDSTATTLTTFGSAIDTAATADSTTGTAVILAVAVSESSATSDTQSAEVGILSFEVLNIPFDGTNGSTAITDSRGHVVTVNGAVVISTAQFVDGGSSGSFPGDTSDYLSIPTSEDFDFGTGDFAIKAKIRLANVSSGLKTICTNRASLADDYGYSFFVDTTSLRFVAWKPTSVIQINITGGTFAAATWYEVEIRRVGIDFNLLVDGASVASTSTSETMYSSTSAMDIGRDKAVSGRNMNGYIDSLKIFKGGIS